MKRLRNYGVNSQATCMADILWTRTLLQTDSCKITFCSYTSYQKPHCTGNSKHSSNQELNESSTQIELIWLAHQKQSARDTQLIQILIHSKTADHSVMSKVYWPHIGRRILYYFRTSFFFSYMRGSSAAAMITVLPLSQSRSAQGIDRLAALG